VDDPARGLLITHPRAASDPATPCASHATPIAAEAPMKTYQVNATVVQPQTRVMTTSPASMNVRGRPVV